ncbi:hypothetical protein HDU76_006845 [Blyttiomyces sp. JEL0837]|nr:hypothetical protein HDU76_006845 [Blyttiomyces sp. JEL0837]
MQPPLRTFSLDMTRTTQTTTIITSSRITAAELLIPPVARPNQQQSSITNIPRINSIISSTHISHFDTSLRPIPVKRPNVPTPIFIPRFPLLFIMITPPTPPAMRLQYSMTSLQSVGSCDSAGDEDTLRGSDYEDVDSSKVGIKTRCLVNPGDYLKVPTGVIPRAHRYRTFRSDRVGVLAGSKKSNINPKVAKINIITKDTDVKMDVDVVDYVDTKMEVLDIVRPSLNLDKMMMGEGIDSIDDDDDTVEGDVGGNFDTTEVGVQMERGAGCKRVRFDLSMNVEW